MNTSRSSSGKLSPHPARRLAGPRLAIAVAAGAALVAGGLGVGMHTGVAAPPPQPWQHLPPPHDLSVQIRSDMRARMGRHGNVMSNLLRAVVLLDRPTIRVLAGRIADEELIARANQMGPDADRLPLPEDFFNQQSALRTAAEQLASAAMRDDTDADMADRFATVAKTCVVCHSVYVRGRPRPSP